MNSTAGFDQTDNAFRSNKMFGTNNQAKKNEDDNHQ